MCLASSRALPHSIQDNHALIDLMGQSNHPEGSENVWHTPCAVTVLWAAEAGEKGPCTEPMLPKSPRPPTLPSG